LEEIMETTTRIGPVSRKRVWAGRIISAVPVLLLLMGAVSSFVQPASGVKGFEEFGYPRRLLPVLGAVELVCAILYVIPQTAVLGAILLTGYLGGATATHVRVGDPKFVVPVIVGIIIWVGLLLREDRLSGLIPLRSRRVG
jgi:hypothetical protein